MAVLSRYKPFPDPDHDRRIRHRRIGSISVGDGINTGIKRQRAPHIAFRIRDHGDPVFPQDMYGFLRILCRGSTDPFYGCLSRPKRFRKADRPAQGIRMLPVTHDDPAVCVKQPPGNGAGRQARTANIH